MNNFLVMEYHAHDVDWWGDLVEGEPTIAGGFITSTTGRAMG